LPTLALRVPIDRSHLARYTFGNVALEIEVLGLFASQAPEALLALRGAATARSWRDAAHTLKGSARAVGAWHVATLAERAEAMHDCLAPAIRDCILDEIELALDDACRYVAGLAPAA
jgi:HPt (histidine-containing phosphotransfer) domain-containing protein